MFDKEPDMSLEMEQTDGFAKGLLWQKRKSDQTRIAILEAAVDCLLNHGYANLTTQLVVKVACMSRGAVLYHYGNKIALIQSVIEHVCQKRLQSFHVHVSALTEKQRVQELGGLKALRDALLTRYYRAYLELSFAARTDPELKAIFVPKARDFERTWSRESLRVFPEWQNKGDTYDLARHFVIALMDGTLMNSEAWDGAASEDALLDLTSNVLRAMLSDSPVKRTRARTLAS